MDMVLSCKQKGVALKIAVPKRETKSLKCTCKAVKLDYICKHYTWNLSRTIFSQTFLKDFAKIFCDFPLYEIAKKKNQERLGSAFF